MNILINLTIYQVVWLLCVFLENLGALLAFPLILLHLMLSPDRKKDLQLMAILLAAGIVIDGSLHLVGYISFSSPAYPIPLWLAVIWLALASLPHHSLKWLKGRLFLAGLFGSIGGPLAYYAGVRVGAADFNWPLVPSLLILAVIWALLWPAVMYIANIEAATKRIQQTT